MSSPSPATPVTGRFAPSPTGDLHFGSLIAAVASFLEAKSAGGRWLVRIDDIDPPREQPGSAERILRDLDRFGLKPDAPVLYQGSRTEAYRAAVTRLQEQGLAFPCGCSRRDLPESGVYPGTCRAGLAPGKTPRSVRLKVSGEPVRFTDRIQGPQEENLREAVGDFVIWRADDLPAYQLAVVVDDAWQEVSEVVRGADLLDSTARQVHLQGCLDLPTPVYAHHPVALDGDGRKLSKRDGSDPVARLRPARALWLALRFLGQDCPQDLDLDSAWRWALAHWRLDRVPRSREAALAL
ncbi:MAG: tRNA glutamyl-Q(34) synthetase GluQRS [Gammaproteobacteria bacterium]|nr:tRNA glutamyl-Q(34) synthetase GluQRS [Gammaproteobacteria bacterium]